MKALGHPVIQQPCDKQGLTLLIVLLSASRNKKKRAGQLGGSECPHPWEKGTPLDRGSREKVVTQNRVAPLSVPLGLGSPSAFTHDMGVCGHCNQYPVAQSSPTTVEKKLEECWRQKSECTKKEIHPPNDCLGDFKTAPPFPCFTPAAGDSTNRIVKCEQKNLYGNCLARLQP